MPILNNSAGAAVPVRERREISGNLASLNSELVLDVNGDENALLEFRAAVGFVGTLSFSGSIDGTNYFSVAAYPYSIGCAGGTIPLAGQPLLLEALSGVSTRLYAIPCGQLKKLRVQATAFTSGTGVASWISDAQDSINTAIDGKPSTLLVTATAATGVAVTATLPAVAGLRHIIDLITVTRTPTSLLLASATPVVITTTNLPGTPSLTMGADAAAIGADKVAEIDFGSTGLAASVLSTATTVVCPATTGVIWRINVVYRLGL